MSGLELVGVAAAAALCTAALSYRKAAKDAGPPQPSTKYGKAARHLFPTDYSFTHLNHGSYGVAPHAVIRHARDLMLGIEAFPDDFFRRTALPRFKAAADVVAAFVGAEPGSVVFVDNATAGVNTVLRSMPFGRGDAILINDNTYGAVKNAVADRAANTGASVVTYTFPLPLPADGAAASALLVSQFASVLDANPSVRLAILDHITSPTAIVMPLQAMVEEAHKRGVRILIDGAHAPGQLPLSLSTLGADWYVGNLHKWAYTLKGVALLYCSPREGGAVQALTQGPIISHFWRKSLAERFYMQGTNDQSRYLSAPFALQWVDTALGGWAAVREHNATLATRGAEVLMRAWGTDRLLPPSMCAPFLIVVECPLDWKVWVRRQEQGGNMVDCRGLSDEEAEAALAKDEGVNERVATAIFTGWRIQGQFFTWKVGGRVRLWSRISAQVYNTLEEYEYFARAVMELKRRTEA